MEIYNAKKSISLYVDLDGTLIKSDLIYEGLFLAIRKSPLILLHLPFMLLRGKASLKEKLADLVTPDPKLLPYNKNVLDQLRSERASGRILVLATASHKKWAEVVSNYLLLFDGLIATENGCNLKGRKKLMAIRSCKMNNGKFSYIGDSLADMPIWKEAEQIYAVGLSPKNKKILQRFGKETVFFDLEQSLLLSAIKALRPHHCIKNFLLFLPLMMAHSFDTKLWFLVTLGFISFSATASATYILNDLLDIESDRTHPKKKDRPFASGALPCRYGPIIIAALISISAFTAIFLPLMFKFWLAIYLFLTVIYSFWLKRKVLVDIFALASLYTIRIIAGGSAVDLNVSNWLLGVSIFMFTSIAFAKRGIELINATPHEDNLLNGRGYRANDLFLVEQIGITSAFSAVIMLSLYLNSDDVLHLYSRPKLLWGTCLVLMYWLSRFWVKVHRGELYHDPLVDAVKDPISICCGILVFIIALIAV
ncbi:UbiA family prenyltransferase [Desulfosarcina ovata]|uniref:UbiA family prenyltransferase n=1 Tax=Desulfosarcina ovata TaxID=83564 RepID=UPI0012D3486D|nr:UbiA family prenyltransferase [Desulfosarcina ovata]